MLRRGAQIVKRTVAMMEGKASQFMRMIYDVDGKAEARDEEVRVAGEQQMGAFVKAVGKKEKVGLERLLVLESALRDIAGASSASLVELQARLDKGMADVAAVVEGAKRGTEDREAALREQINAALAKIRAYARDMEESLEQERVKLEEVVKMEIRARMQAATELNDKLEDGMAGLARRLEGMNEQQSKAAAAQGALEEAARVLRRDVEQLQDDVANKVIKEALGRVDAALAHLKGSVSELSAKAALEEEARRVGLAELRTYVDANAVDAKVAEETLRVELEALGSELASTRDNLSEALDRKVRMRACVHGTA